MNLLAAVVAVAVSISQFVIAGDIHLDNLGPEGVVGTIQLDADWSGRVFGGLSQDLGFG